MSPEGQAQYTPKKLTVKELQEIRRTTGFSKAQASSMVDTARVRALVEKRPIEKRVKWAKSKLTREERRQLSTGNERAIIKAAEKKVEKHWQAVAFAEFKKRQAKKAQQGQQPVVPNIDRDYDYNPDTGEYVPKRRESEKHTKAGDPIVQYTNMLDTAGAPVDLINKFTRTADGLDDDELDQLLYEAPTEEELYKAKKGHNEGLLEEMFQQLDELLDTYSDYIDEDEDYEE